MVFESRLRGMTMLVALVAVFLSVGACCPRPPQYGEPWSVEVTPVEDTNPTKTQHTFIATVYDQSGHPIPNVQVHWILARTGDAVGDIVTYDDQDLTGTWYDLTTKTDNHYAVSYTNEKSAILHRGMRWVADEASWTDFEVGPGQTWCTITSPVEGTSHMIAYVPAIKDALCHKFFAVKHWQRVPHLTIKKDCPPQALLGTEFQYTLTVTNDGEGATPGPVEVTEALPEGISIVDGASFPQNIGVLNPGDSRTITFRVRADTPGAKVNRTEARAGEFVARGECTTLVTDYGIEIVKECSGSYLKGTPVPFTIRVTNSKDANLTNVVINDPLPANVEFVSAQASKGTAAFQGGAVVWSGFDLAARESATLTISTTGVTLGQVRNVATVTANVVGAEVQVSAKSECTCEITGLPVLNIDKVCDPTTAALGDTVNFRITVWNSGAADAVNVVVNDMVPAGMQAQGQTSWTIDRLPPGTQASGQTFTLQAVVMNTGRFENVATATSAGMAEVRASCTVDVAPPVLTIRKECMAVNPLPGLDPADNNVLNRMGEGKFVITVTNGNVRAMEVVVVDELPLDANGRTERVQYKSSNPPGNYDPSTHRITWNLGTLEAGQVVPIEVIVTGMITGQAMNRATVTAKGFPGAQDGCPLWILGPAAFQNMVVDALNGNPDADNFVVDTPFDYVVTLENEGEMELKLEVAFTLTAGLKLDTSRQIGFLSNPRSTDVTKVLNVTDQGGKYVLEGFQLLARPQGTIYLKIPVIGTRVTTTDAEKIRLDINWWNYYHGKTLEPKGTSTVEETSTIDPK